MAISGFECTALCTDGSPYLLAQSNGVERNLAEWASINQQELAVALQQHRAIVFRGFAENESDFEDFVRRLTIPLGYCYRSTPRTSVGKNLYTATEYPASSSIPVHCENAYQRQWPRKIFFYCVTPAASGGQTPLANVEMATELIDPAIKKTFSEKGVLYVRNYGGGLDLPWQTVFQTSSASEMERFCDANGISWSWTGVDRLQTRQVRPALATHPETGQILWFNQAHLFNIGSLDEETRQAMLSMFDIGSLPRNSYYGDGTPIEARALTDIQSAFDRSTSVFTWQRGDILMADNMLVAHGRQPFVGPRKVLVMMGDLFEGQP